MSKNSEFLSDIKSGAFRVLGTFFGNLAFESLDSLHKNKEFANLSVLYLKPSENVKNIDSENIDQTNTLPSIKEQDLVNGSAKMIMSVSEKLLTLKNKNIYNARDFLEMDNRYYTEKLERNLSDPNKNIIDKLYDFCEIAESLNRSSRGFIKELEAEKVGIDETKRIISQVDDLLQDNLTNIIKSEKTKIKPKMI